MCIYACPRVLDWSFLYSACGSGAAWGKPHYRTLEQALLCNPPCKHGPLRGKVRLLCSKSGGGTTRVFLTIYRPATFSPMEINYIAWLYDACRSQKCNLDPYWLTFKYYTKNFQTKMFFSVKFGCQSIAFPYRFLRTTIIMDSCYVVYFHRWKRCRPTDG